VIAKPSRNVRREDRISDRLNRNGFSTVLNATYATPNEITAAPVRRETLLFPTANTARTMKGQCQRYHEYERRPIHLIGRVPSIFMMKVGLDESVTWPPRMTKPAPATGQRALMPGYEVVSLKARSA
jgi:hypothetical protein